jgi:hypothetical protein
MLNLPGRTNQELQDQLDKHIDYLYSLQPEPNLRIAVYGIEALHLCEQLEGCGVLRKSPQQPEQVNRWHFDWTIEGWRYAKSRHDVPDAFKEE